MWSRYGRNQVVEGSTLTSSRDTVPRSILFYVFSLNCLSEGFLPPCQETSSSLLLNFSLFVTGISWDSCLEEQKSQLQLAYWRRDIFVEESEKSGV